jgi:Domain of unknown function (DUF397)
MSTAVERALGRAQWRKSSHSQGQNTCVEVASAAGWVGVRDSTLGVHSPVLLVGPGEWRALLGQLRG